MKYPIKSIEVQVREWQVGDFHAAVSFARWDVEDVTKRGKHTLKNSKYSQYYHPTRASILRCICAMEAMTKREVS